MSSTPATAVFERALAAYNMSDFEQTVEHCRAVLTMLSQTNETEVEALKDDAFERLIMAYQRMGEFDRAREAVTEWQATSQRPQGQVQALIQQCRVEDFTGHYEAAVRLIKKAINQADSLGYRRGLGIAKRVYADIHWKQGHPEEALQLGQEALALLEMVGDLEHQAAARVSLAAAYHSSGLFYKSIQQLQRTARIVEQLGRRFELSIVYSNLGETYAELFAMQKALEAHQKALELVGLERAHADNIRNLGVALIAVGREDEGRQHLDIALERARRSNNPDMIAQALYSLGEANFAVQRLDEAEQQGQELLDIANHLDSLRHRIRAWMILGRVAQQKGDHAQAQTLLNECSMAAQRSDDRHAIWKTHAALYDLLRESMPPLAEIHRRIASEMMTHILAGIDDRELCEIFKSAAPVRSVFGTGS